MCVLGVVARLLLRLDQFRFGSGRLERKSRDLRAKIFRVVLINRVARSPTDDTPVVA